MKSKIIAVFLSVSVLSLCMSSGSALADTSGSEGFQEYVMYNINLVTGEEGYESIPISDDDFLEENISDIIPENNNDTGISPNAYIGEDDSYEILDTYNMPYKAVCNLKTYWDTDGDGETDLISGGSGCIIGRRVLITAGHVIYNKSRGGKCKGVKVYPAQQRYYTPYTYNATNLYVNADYYENPKTEDDWGLIILDDYAGDITGWLELRNCSSYNMLGENVSVIGYPGGKDKDRKTMWRSDGKIVEEFTETLRYDCDTTGGCSGGPVIDANDNIVAIHSGGTTNKSNVGAKVDDFMCRVADVLVRMYNH